MSHGARGPLDRGHCALRPPPGATGGSSPQTGERAQPRACVPPEHGDVNNAACTAQTCATLVKGPVLASAGGLGETWHSGLL